MGKAHVPAEEPAHDILAAEAFAVPTSDPALHHGPVLLPDDPTGIAGPHDTLAAEEFAMPAPPLHPAGALVPSAPSPWIRVAPVALGGLFLILLLRAFRRRKR
jgi:hypothetical protein